MFSTEAGMLRIEQICLVSRLFYMCIS